MQFDKAAEVLKGIPYTGEDKGRFFYDFILARRPQRVLELGVAHGVSTCYQAAALDEYGGHIDCVDLQREVDPNVEGLSAKLGLAERVSSYREASSYTWFLKKTIEAQTRDGVCEPLYDLIFIDGPKDWTVDGCAFFLADKLLRPGGWIMLDDYSWTYAKRNLTEGYVFKTLSPEELAEPQVEAIFRLLVMQHPSYSNFEVWDDSLAFAQKVASEVRTLRYTTKFTPMYTFKRLAKKLLGRR